MAIEMSTAPDAAHKAVRTVIDALAANAAFRTPNLRRADPSALVLSMPHRVSLLPLDQIHGGSKLRSAVRFKGWRFLVYEAGRPIAAAEAVSIGSGEYRFGMLNEGPLVEGTTDAIQRAEHLEKLSSGRFEPWLLLVPAIYVAALWLQEADEDADWFLPMPPAHPRFDSFEPKRTRDFLDIVQDLGARVPTTDSARGG